MYQFASIVYSSGPNPQEETVLFISGIPVFHARDIQLEWSMEEVIVSRSSMLHDELFYPPGWIGKSSHVLIELKLKSSQKISILSLKTKEN
jgi:hypothetical protein